MSSEPTDQRIAEIRELLKEAMASLPMLDPREIFLTAQERRDAAIVTLKRRVMVDIPYLLQRLEQVTAERDTLADRLGTTEGSLALVRKRAEAAEATIASLRTLLERLRMRREFSGSCDIPGCGCDGSELLIEVDAALASIPSSAVSRTAEAQEGGQR